MPVSHRRPGSGLLQLDCLRHGTTVEVEAGVYPSHRGGHLSVDALISLSRVRLDPTVYDVVYCSPAARCLETVKGLRLTTWVEEPRLLDRNLGVFVGMKAEDARQLHPYDFALFTALDPDAVLPHGESRTDHLTRVRAWLADLPAKGRVLAITHGGTIDLLRRLGTGAALHGGRPQKGGLHGTITRFARKQGELRWIADGIHPGA